MIDEARIPLVIAGAAEDAAPDLAHLAAIARTLEYGRDVEFDEAARNIYLTEAGLARVEQLLPCENLYAPEQLELLTRLNCALHAEFLLQRDVDYIARQGKIEHVDEFTGRVADQRRWPDGLQAALEAKENLPRQTQGAILNSITLQHFLQGYPKICGMTATAQAAADEFRQFYHLPIVVIPPNRPCRRIDHPDVIFRTKAEKHAALIQEILTVIRLGGVTEAEKSQVMALGGLYVIGTNTHESQRIDQQLRGRAGRQGDPGASRFFLSLEDDLFVKYRFQALLPPEILSGERPGALDHPLLSSEIARLQRIIEGQHLEIKKTLCQYAEMVEQQRQVMFAKREEMLYPVAAAEFFALHAPETYQACLARFGAETVQRGSQKILCACCDTSWARYLAEIAEIREGIHLHRIGGQNPYLEFQKFAVQRFAEELQTCETEAVHIFRTLQLTGKDMALETQGLHIPSTTWVYLINDDPFEHEHGLQLLGNVGLAAGGAFLYNWPLMLLALIIAKFKKKKR